MTEAPPPSSLVSNSAWVLAARVVAILVGGGLSVYAIRELPIDEWGRYSTVISLIAVFAVFMEAGLSSLALRELSVPGADRRSTLGTAMSAVLVTGTVSLVLMCSVAALLGYWSSPALMLLAAAVLIARGLGLPLHAAFNAARVLRYPSVLSTLGVVVSATVAIVLIAGGMAAPALLIGMLAMHLIMVAGGYVLLRRKLGLRSRPRRPDAEVRRFMRAAVPIALTGGLTIVYQRLDILMLSKLADERDVALYAVPFSLLQYSWMIPQTVAAAFYPLLAADLAHDRTAAARSFWLVVRIFFVVSAPITIMFVVAGEPLLTTVFGQQYADSSQVLAIMAWISLLGVQNYVLWYGILASGQERKVVAIQAAGLVVNAALNIVLIPAFGPEGAAVALLVSDLIVVAGQAAIVHRYVFPIPWIAIFRGPIFAGVVAAVPVLVFVDVSKVLAGTVGATTYCAALLGLRYVSWEEWLPLRVAVRRALARLRLREAGA